MTHTIYSYLFRQLIHGLLFFLALIYLIPGSVAQNNQLGTETIKTPTYYLSKGFEFKKTDNFSEAIRYFTKALTLSEKEKDSASMCLSMYNIGEINSKMGNQERAIQYLEKALAIAMVLNTGSEISMIRNGIGLVQLEQKKYDAAIDNFKSILTISLKEGDSMRIMKSYINIGLAYASLEKTSESKKSYEKALSMSKLLHDSASEAVCYINIGDCFRSLKQPDSAIVNLHKAELLSASLSPYDQLILYGGLNLAYEDKKDYKKALSYYKKHYAIVSSLYSKQSDEIVNQLEAKYQSEKKEREILQLSLEKNQSVLELAKKQKTLNYRTTLLVFSFILLSIIVFFGYFLFRQNRSKEKMNRLLSKQNAEIIEQKKTIEENLVYTQQLQVALKHDLNHYIQSALRKQMNPHFVFNSLNSIQRFILQNDKVLANQYLADFAKLMRRVLEHSRKEFISLKEELDTLQLYIGLEQRRFDNKFEYELSIDENITPSMYLIPPFILQPYVENAIWHGLLHKNTKGLLQIKLQKKESFILFSIIDDGVGRHAAGLRNTHTPSHESLATKITKKRVEAINYLNEGQISIVIEDLMDKDTIACGTAVHIRIPLASIFQKSIKENNT